MMKKALTLIMRPTDSDIKKMINNNYLNVERNYLTLKMLVESMTIRNIWMIFNLIKTKNKKQSIYLVIKMVDQPII